MRTVHQWMKRLRALRHAVRDERGLPRLEGWASWARYSMRTSLWRDQSCFLDFLDKQH
jgi:hypothetical protein